MDGDLFAGVPRLELMPSSDGMLVGATAGRDPCGIEIGPDEALAAGMWLLDACRGLARDRLEVPEVMGPSAMRLERYAGGDVGACLITLDIGEEPVQVMLNRYQAMLAGEHLICHAISAGARPSAQSALDPQPSVAL